MRTPLSAAWRVLSRATMVALSATSVSFAACGGEDGAASGDGPDASGGLILPDVPGGAGGDDTTAPGSDTGGGTPGADASAPAPDSAGGDDSGAPVGADGTSGATDGTSSGGDDATAGGDDTTAGADTGGGLSTCGQEELTMEVGLIPPSILLLLDRSASMYERWEPTTDAVRAVVETVDGQANLGLMMFPSEGRCGITQTPQVPIGPNNGSRIVSAMTAASWGGLTPMGIATIAAKDYLKNLTASGEVALVLIADGEPSTTCRQSCDTCDCRYMGSCMYCSGEPACDMKEVELPVAELAAAGIRTWVVGFAGGFGEPEFLKRLATLGGTVNDAPQPNGFFDAGEGAQLGQILGQIQSQMAACRARVTVPPGFAFPTVKINGVTIARDQTRTNGWDWMAPGDLSFFGDACTQAQAAGADVQISFLCK
jgi:hypothetical protein